MGFHVHVSMREDSYYAVLFDRNFTNYFKDMILDELDIHNRLDNSFCYNSYNDTYFRHHFPRSARGYAREFDRYKMINFLSAFGKFGTMEFRIFPSRPTCDMYDYVKFTIKHINKYLDKHLKEFGESEEIQLIRTYDEYTNTDFVLIPQLNVLNI
jgi:hypothetical protein